MSVRAPISCLILTAAILCGTPAVAGIYKWTDTQGVVHYGDKPPDQGSSERVNIQPIPSSGSADVIRDDAGASRTIARPSVAQQPLDVVLYSTKTCGYCRKLRALFRQHGVAWQEIDIESSQAAEQEFKSRGGHGVPLVFINGQRIQGFSEEDTTEVLARYGY